MINKKNIRQMPSRITHIVCNLCSCSNVFPYFIFTRFAFLAENFVKTRMFTPAVGRRRCRQNLLAISQARKQSNTFILVYIYPRHNTDENMQLLPKRQTLAFVSCKHGERTNFLKSSPLTSGQKFS